MSGSDNDEPRRKSRSRHRSESDSDSDNKKRSDKYDDRRHRRHRSHSSSSRHGRSSRDDDDSYSHKRRRPRYRSRDRDTDDEETKRSSSRTTEKRSSEPEDREEQPRAKKRRSGWDKAPELTEVPGVPTETLLAMEAAKQLGLNAQGATGVTAPMQVIPPVPTAIPGVNAPDTRIYVGSLHFSLDEADVRTAFESFGTIKSLNMSKEATTGLSKGYCFIEFESAEAAQLAIETMNGVDIAGREIKVGRPHMSHPLARGVLPLTSSIANAQLAMYGANPAQAAAASMAMQAAAATPSHSRIYVGSVNWDATAYDLAAVFATFGPIRRLSLQPNPETGKHKGFGFVEYTEQAAAEKALGANVTIAGRPVKVGRAAAASAINPSSYPPMYYLENIPQATAGQPLVLPPQPHMATVPVPVLASVMIPPAMLPTAGAGVAGAGAAAVHIDAVESLEDDKAISRSQRHTLMERLARATDAPSNVVYLHDMVGAGEVDERLEPELKEECSKYGRVEQVVIFEDRANSGAVKIFVVFGSTDEAVKCRDVMHGRWFGGRVIQSALYPQDKFLAGNYSLNPLLPK